MMTIDKLETSIEKLSDKVKQVLSFKFKDEALDTEAESLKDDIIAALEDYLDLAGEDWENSSQNNEDDS